ncbi:MAG TPA: CopD family protein, partial [Nitrospirota bacterium]|nr:CopD family protein [Nitrospirota bacterium]
GALTETGKQFLKELKSEGLYRPLTTAQHTIRLIVGYFHMLAAIIWFGTIMYVHVLLKPAYASKGLPKGELRLGWISMIVILVTGILLTIARIPSWGAFFTTRFGVLLGIKIFLFLIMLASAVIVTVYIGPKLRKQKSLGPGMENGVCTPDGLCQFDGKDGRPAYFAYKGIIYDVTKSRLWKNGSHLSKHAAGNDLTELLATAPHGEEKVLAMQQVGKLLASGERPKQPFHLRLFYFFAYMNLALVFVITFVIALWRWW